MHVKLSYSSLLSALQHLHRRRVQAAGTDTSVQLYDYRVRSNLQSPQNANADSIKGKLHMGNRVARHNTRFSPSPRNMLLPTLAPKVLN
jgi:hypothetical protein